MIPTPSAPPSSGDFGHGGGEPGAPPSTPSAPSGSSGQSSGGGPGGNPSSSSEGPVFHGGGPGSNPQANGDAPTTIGQSTQFPGSPGAQSFAAGSNGSSSGGGNNAQGAGRAQNGSLGTGSIAVGGYPDPFKQCDAETGACHYTFYVDIPAGDAERAAAGFWNFLRGLLLPSQAIGQSQRLSIFFSRLRSAPSARSADEALELLAKTLDAVEDAYSGVEKVAEPGLKYAGRMYAPRADNITRLADGSIKAVTRGHDILFGPNGSIRLFARKTGELVFSKLGAP